MTSTHKRGRPKSAATIQREQDRAEVEKVLQDAAASFPMSHKGRKEMNDLLESLDRWETQTLQEYHLSPMKKETAYAMASLGDESVEGHEEEIIATYEKARLRGVNARTVGTEKIANAAKERRDQFFKENTPVIDRMLKQGRSDSDIAQKMCNRPLSEHGVSVRTIRRWIAAYRSKKLAKSIA